MRRPVGAPVAPPLTRLRTWLGSFAPQRVRLLRKPFLQDRVGTYLMEVVAIREIDALLDGKLRARERAVSEAPSAPAIELPVLSGYDGQCLAYLLVCQVRNFLGRAQDVAPFQIIVIQGLLGWFANQEYAVSLTAASTIETGSPGGDFSISCRLSRGEVSRAAGPGS